NDAVVVIKGRARKRDDEITLQALDVTIPDITAGTDQPLMLTLPSARCVPPVGERLRGTRTTHPEPSEEHLKLTAQGKASLMRVDSVLRVIRSLVLYGELKALLGPNCLV